MTTRQIVKLIRALKHESSDVRERAAYEMGVIGYVSTVPALIAALKDKQDSVCQGAAWSLQKFGDAATLPRKILASRHLSAQEKLNTIESLRCVRYTNGITTLHYKFPDTRTLCQMILEEDDHEARAGAQEVLNLLDSKTLLRASQRETAADSQQLLRAAATAPSETQPETLLRSSDEPDENMKSEKAQSTLWQCLFGKQTDAA